ncbi:unnamed protein product [Parajaminaea phylloscopi]
MAEAKQKRAPRACDACRTRKIRCSGLESSDGKCKRCLRFDISCTFAMPVKRPAPSSAVEELQARIAYLEEKLARMGHRVSEDDYAEARGLDRTGDEGFLEDADPNNGDSDAPTDSEQDESAFVPTIWSATGPLERSIVRNFRSSPPRANGSPVGTVDGNGDDVTPGRGEQSMTTSEGGGQESEAGLMAYLGSSSALFPLIISRQIPKTIKSAIKANVLLRYVRLEYWDIQTAPFDEQLEDDVHAFWPSPDDASLLIDCYLEHIAPFQPLGLTREAIWTDYAANPEDATSSRVRLARLYTIFAAASWHSELGLDRVNNRPHLAGLPFWLASRWFAKDDADLSEPLVTAQTLFLQSSFAQAYPPLIPQAWRLAGNALRVLMDIGAHRASLMKQLSNNSPERRMTFWTAYAHEKMIMSQSGRPPSLWSEWVDAKLVKEDSLWLWLSVKNVFIIERVLKLKYTASRRSGDEGRHSANSILPRISRLEKEIEEVEKDLSIGMRHSIRLAVRGTRLLFNQPELLSSKSVSAQITETSVADVEMILSETAALDLSKMGTFGVSSLGRAAVLAHVLDQSAVPAVRQAFASRGLKRLATSVVRKLESRFTLAGKLCDLLALPPISTFDAASPTSASTTASPSDIRAKAFRELREPAPPAAGRGSANGSRSFDQGNASMPAMTPQSHFAPAEPISAQDVYPLSTASANSGRQDVPTQPAATHFAGMGDFDWSAAPALPQPIIPLQQQQQQQQQQHPDLGVAQQPVQAFSTSDFLPDGSGQAFFGTETLDDLSFLFNIEGGQGLAGWL